MKVHNDYLATAPYLTHIFLVFGFSEEIPLIPSKAFDTDNIQRIDSKIYGNTISSERAFSLGSPRYSIFSERNLVKATPRGTTEFRNTYPLKQQKHEEKSDTDVTLC